MPDRSFSHRIPSKNSFVNISPVKSQEKSYPPNQLEYDSKPFQEPILSFTLKISDFLLGYYRYFLDKPNVWL